MFPVKLLSNTKGPINLLPSTPHHTFTENILWKLVTRVSCGFSWEHVCTFRELVILSWVIDASSVNKMTLNSSGCAVIQWHKSNVEHGRLVPDVVPFDHGKDINLPHVKFATPAYMITPMREAILRVDRRGLL